MKRTNSSRITLTLVAACALHPLAGCVYDPMTGTYALDTKALELISNIAVSSLANSMASRGEKETIDRSEARAMAIESQAIIDPSAARRSGAGPWPLDVEGDFGAYTCGGQTYWVAAFLTGKQTSTKALDELAASWTAAHYATDNSLRWDGTPYRLAMASGGAVVLLRYNATTNDIGWVQIHLDGGQMHTLTNDGARGEIATLGRTVFRWSGGQGECDVTLFVANTAKDAAGATPSGVFWFD
jgi:hypothetical protein